MMLLAGSTRTERAAYIQETFRCHNGDCENCGVCHFFAGSSPEKVFADFIDGRREFMEITTEWNQRHYR